MGYIAVICVYLVALVVYGLIIARKKVKTSDDMMTGGHRIPFIILVGSLLATWCGGGGITGTAAFIFNGGVWMGLLGYLAAPLGVLLLYFIAGRVRQSNKVTVPEIMGARYGNAARILSAVCIILAYVGVLATQLKATSNIMVLLASSSGVALDPLVALAVSAAVVLAVTVGGGLVSVAYSDAVSALLMLGGFALAIPVLMVTASGMGLSVPAEKMQLTGSLGPVTLLGFFIPTLAIILGDQNMLQRFASARNSREARRSNVGMLLGEIAVMVLTIALVAQAMKFYPTLQTPSNVIFQVVLDYLPFALGAVVMCACMAFIVTTADSYLLSASTNLTNDIFVRFIRPGASDRQRLLVLRLTIVLLSVAAVLLSSFFPTVLQLQLTAYTMYGATITPAVLFALFSRRVTPVAGLAGIATGALVTIVWTALGTPYGINSALLAVPASVLSIVLATALSRPVAEHSLEQLYAPGAE